MDFGSASDNNNNNKKHNCFCVEVSPRVFAHKQRTVSVTVKHFADDCKCHVTRAAVRQLNQGVVMERLQHSAGSGQSVVVVVPLREERDSQFQLLYAFALLCSSRPCNQHLLVI
ncbi:hypothetical protein niasHS_000745 [Heterodera schachtii]|uniref:Uncharacterized protein n=1 Tax=Heterodera schachtii TaxID=97005 RepID=A0ABD2KKT9_HETSC